MIILPQKKYSNNYSASLHKYVLWDCEKNKIVFVSPSKTMIDQMTMYYNEIA